MKRSTLVAFGVLVVLIGVVYWLEQDGSGGSDVEVVFDVTPEDIDRVEIRRLDEEPVVIERTGAGEAFRVVAPIAAACDPREVDLILSNLTSLARERSFAPDAGKGLGEFGLETPKLEVRFTTADAEHGVRFGSDTITESNQYAALLGGNDILVVASHVSNNLDKSAWDLREKAIFHIAAGAEPSRVSITRANETLVLGNDTGVWMTHASPRTRVDRSAVTGMVSRFREAEMLGEPDQSAATGLDHPTHRLDVTFETDHEPVALEIGDRTNVDYYARASSRSMAFIIEGGLVDELQVDPRAWWSKKLIHHPTTEATEVHITDAADNSKTMSRAQAQDLLRALSSATADEIVTTPPSGEPEYVVAIVTDTVHDEITFRVDSDNAFATRENEDVALRLPVETWTELANLLASALLASHPD